MAIGDTDVSKFKGKSIDQLQVVVPETNDETDDFSESDVEDKNSALPESGVSQVSAISKELEDGISKEGNNEYAIATEAPKKSGKIRTKIMWTPNQKKIVYDKFAKFLKPTSGYPSLQLCHEVSQKYKQQLKGRDGRSLYAWVQGEQRRLLKCSAI
ncbi:hypothetical protein RI129_003072 [Pyrocoelia pectoralis]|uniref:Uncharacterized protein n=1 Tax=Pyrocoelia pectoralis TaxID=417401 RepID=A0AAN7VH78_9COLE